MNDIAYWKLKRCAFLPSMLYPFLFLSTPAAPFTAFIWTVCVCVCECVRVHWAWPPFVFWCFATAMLTFFEAWPAFHICAGQAVLFALTIMGDPQLLFRTLEEPLKCPRSSIALRCTAETPQSSGWGENSVSRAQLCCASVKPLVLWMCARRRLRDQIRWACLHAAKAR